MSDHFMSTFRPFKSSTVINFILKKEKIRFIYEAGLETTRKAAAVK